MDNTLLFAVTVVAYSVIWALFDAITDEPIPFRQGLTVKRMAWMMILCLPVNINGNLFTVIGNAKSSRDIYSVGSLYQKATGDAVTMLGAGYQRAGRDAINTMGLAGYQNADRDAEVAIGYAGYQKAGRDAITFIGATGCQKAKNKSLLGLGLVVYQSEGGGKEKILGLERVKD